MSKTSISFISEPVVVTGIEIVIRKGVLKEIIVYKLKGAKIDYSGVEE